MLETNYLILRYQTLGVLPCNLLGKSNFSIIELLAELYSRFFSNCCTTSGSRRLQLCWANNECCFVSKFKLLLRILSICLKRQREMKKNLIKSVVLTRWQLIDNSSDKETKNLSSDYNSRFVKYFKFISQSIKNATRSYLL